MKKVLVFLLALCMLLTLCACTDPNEEAFESGKALENAIEALQSLNHYAEITDMIADAQKQINTQKYEFLFGTWKSSTWPDSIIEFHEDGTCVAGEESRPYDSGSYTVKNDRITITGLPVVANAEEGGITTVIPLDITQENGIYCLTVEGDAYIREEDFDRFVEEHTVELTLDNYLDYYEWVESRGDEKDDYNNTNIVFIDHILELKEGYESRVSLSLSEAEIEYTYESRYFDGENLVIDYDTLECSGASYSNTETKSETVSLYQGPAVSYGVFYFSEPGYKSVTISSQPEIVRMEGHLVIW